MAIAGVVLGLTVPVGAAIQPYSTTSEGLKVGRLIVWPSIGLEMWSDDNVMYRSNDQPGQGVITSGIFVVQPRLLVDLPIGQSRIRWVYAPVFRSYTSHDFTQDQRVSHFFDFEAIRVGPVVTLKIADHYVKGSVELLEVDRGGEAVFGLTPFTTNSPEFEATVWMGARSGITFLARNTTVHFANEDKANFFGYDRNELELRFNRQMGRETLAYVFGRVENTVQERPVDIFGDVSLDGRTAGIGFHRTINQEIVSYGNVGYQTIDFVGSKADYRGPTADVTASWQIGDVTGLDFEFIHQAFPSFFMNNNYFTNSELRLRLIHQFGRAMFWQAGLTGMNNAYPTPISILVTPATAPGFDCNPRVPDPDHPGETMCGGDGVIDSFESYAPSVGQRRRDRMYRMEFGLGWHLGQITRLLIGYNSEQRRSNIEQEISGRLVHSSDYDVNRLFFRMEMGWR